MPQLVALPVWFGDLQPAAATHGGVFARAAEAARHLLAEPCEVGVLHGDVRHANVLHFGARGWLGIDPKGLWGERAFEYANLFCNPALADPSRPVAILPDRFARRLEIVAGRSGIDRRRLLHCVVAWTGLSAVWLIGDGRSAVIPVRIAELAIAALDR